MSVDSKENIPKAVKFNYLTGLYNENVKKCVCSLNITNENYDIAVQILKGRYVNRQMLISSHMEALFILNSVKQKNDVKGPSKIYDQGESSIRNLNLLNVDQKSCGIFLLYLLSENNCNKKVWRRGYEN